MEINKEASQSLFVKYHIKTVLISIIFFFLGAFSTFYYEYYYRKLVIYLLKNFSDDKLQFFGKYFHLFPSNSFNLITGLFFVLTFLFFKFCNKNKGIKFLVSIMLFFMTLIITTLLESIILIAECTACKDGNRKMFIGNIPFDNYYILSLSVSIVFLLIILVRNVKDNKKSPKRAFQYLKH